MTTYTAKIINLFNADDEYDGSEVIKMINKFADSETNKRQQETEKMPFGKFRGKLIKEILVFDKQYLQWIVRQDVMKNFTKLKETIEALL